MNKELWNKFTNDNLVVNCKTESEAEEFLNYCNEQGIRWSGERDELTSRSYWYDYKESTCYNAERPDSMCFSRRDYFISKGYEIISYQEILKEDINQSVRRFYYGDEILKMIREGQLEEGVKLIGLYKDVYEAKFIFKKAINDTYYIEEIGSEDNDLDSWDLINMTFMIEEKEYMTFDEARKSGKKFKYKSWNRFRNIQEVCRKLPGYTYINQMLDEKAWEVEEGIING